MPTEKYIVQFKLLGGAKVTKTILASSEGDAATRAVRKFRATEILTIKKVKQ